MYKSKVFVSILRYEILQFNEYKNYHKDIMPAEGLASPSGSVAVGVPLT